MCCEWPHLQTNRDIDNIQNSVFAFQSTSPGRISVSGTSQKWRIPRTVSSIRPVVHFVTSMLGGPMWPKWTSTHEHSSWPFCPWNGLHFLIWFLTLCSPTLHNSYPFFGCWHLIIYFLGHFFEAFFSSPPNPDLYITIALSYILALFQCCPILFSCHSKCLHYLHMANRALGEALAFRHSSLPWGNTDLYTSETNTHCGLPKWSKALLLGITIFRLLT